MTSSSGTNGHAVGRVEQDLRSDGLGAVDDLAHRQNAAGLHLHLAERDELRARRDGVDELIDLVDLHDVHAALSRDEQREQHRGEVRRRHDHPIAGLQRRHDDPHPDRDAGHQRHPRRRRPDEPTERRSRSLGLLVPLDPHARAGLPRLERLTCDSERRLRRQPVRRGIEIRQARIRPEHRPNAGIHGRSLGRRDSKAEDDDLDWFALALQVQHPAFEV